MTFKLPASDKTPALRVNLLPSNSDQQAVGQQQLTEISLNDSSMNRSDMNLNGQADQQEQSANSFLSLNQETPSASELPSYIEAVRSKKFEANDLPPSYFPDQPTNPINNSNETRIVIDASDVKFYLNLSKRLSLF